VAVLCRALRWDKLNRMSDALLPRRIHPLARDVQKPIPKFLISCQSRKPDAFACVVHAFLFCSHWSFAPKPRRTPP
jgi:hypothetical protein